MSISIALTKGRLEKETVKLLDKANYGTEELKDKGRKLVFKDTKKDIKWCCRYWSCRKRYFNGS